VGLTVREAGERDLDPVARLLGELHNPPTAVGDSRAWRSMLSQPDRTILIAELDGEPAGTADLMVLPNLTNGALPRMNVENVAVAASYRRRGVGRALMAEVERRAIEAGCYKIMLMSALHRTGAHRFYEDIGYERVAEGYRRMLT
jgi:ribosomal protein S18 acetylase RimI-like enzyme